MRFGLNLLFTAMLFTVLTLPVAAQKRTAVIDPKTIDIKLDFFEPPSLPVTGGIQVTSNPPGKWLTAQVSYSPYLAYEAQGKQSKKKNFRWMDDLTVEISMILPAASGYGNYILISGKEVLWSVPCDGRKHRAFFAIPPLILERYCKFDKFNKTIAGQIPAFLEIKSKNQDVLARYAHIPKDANANRILQLFNELFQANIGVFKLPTSILPKERTPWNLVEIDAFDLPKSMVEGK